MYIYIYIYRMLVDQQSQARAKDESLLQASEALRTAQDIARRAEIEVEVTKAAEDRLLTQAYIYTYIYICIYIIVYIYIYFYT
jgi:hypothetical protein